MKIRPSTQIAPEGSALQHLRINAAGTAVEFADPPTVPSLTVQDENANVATNVQQIDFQGAGVTATAGTGEVIVTIPGATGGAPTIQDEGTALTVRNTIDFVGAGVTASDDAANSRTVVSIPGGSGGSSGGVTTYTANFTVATADAGGTILGNSASPLTATVPNNTTDAIPVGSKIDVVQWGTGKLQVVAASGVTVSSKNGAAFTSGQFSWLRLIKTATNTWALYGDISGGAYSTTVLSDSPWAYWRGLTDQTTNARNVTLTGTDTAVDSPEAAVGNGYGYSFPAGANYLRPAVQISTSTCTLEAWVKLTATPTTLTSIICCAAAVGSSTADKWLYVGTDGKAHGYVYNAGPQAIDAPSALTLNQWHHVVLVIGDAGTGKLYIDGSMVASNASAGASATASQYPFVHSGGTLSPTPGDSTNSSAIQIAEPAVYTTALTAARVSAHYNA